MWSCRRAMEHRHREPVNPMEIFESILQTLSYVGVFDTLMGMSQTDIVMVFLLSKPAFILTAVVLVWTVHGREVFGRRELPRRVPRSFLSDA